MVIKSPRGDDVNTSNNADEESKLEEDNEGVIFKTRSVRKSKTEK